MKKYIAIVLLFLIAAALSACTSALDEKSEIIAMYRKNEEIFWQAAKSGNFTAVESIRGVQSVYISETYTDISFGGAGFGSSSHYLGIFYSADDSLSAVDVAGMCFPDELTAQGDGYFYQDEDSDNRYYVEPLGNHFFYYEAHY